MPQRVHHLLIVGITDPMTLPHPCLLWVTSKMEPCIIEFTPPKGAKASADHLTAVTIRAIPIFYKKYHVENSQPYFNLMKLLAQTSAI